MCRLKNTPLRFGRRLGSHCAFSPGVSGACANIPQESDRMASVVRGEVFENRAGSTAGREAFTAPSGDALTPKPGGNDYPIGVGERCRRRQPVRSPTDPLDFVFVSKSIENARMYAQAKLPACTPDSVAHLFRFRGVEFLR